MPDIPANPHEFERWYAESSPSWPKELRDAGAVALLDLSMLAELEPGDIDGLKQNMLSARETMAEFRRLYQEWDANNRRTQETK
jgi:hypothetical protein